MRCNRGFNDLRTYLFPGGQIFLNPECGQSLEMLWANHHLLRSTLRVASKTSRVKTRHSRESPA
jgi:hypothetical protein